MSRPMIVAPALIQPLLQPLLPEGLDIRWFQSSDDAMALAPEADIGWFDQFDFAAGARAAAAATRMRWQNTVLTGLSTVPIALARERGVIVTTGAGLNSGNIADYALMGMLALAKGLPAVVRAHDQRQWLPAPPAVGEMEGSQALILGYGAIGQAIAARLRPMGVSVTGVRRTAAPDEGMLGADEWRPLLATFDWILLTAPATPDTRAMIGSAEIAAIKTGARIVNVGRGELIDQEALVTGLESGRVGGAFLDVTDPEPLPADHPLWRAPNCLISMHLAGRSQTSMFRKGAERFAANLRRYLAGEPLQHVVDLAKGY